MTVLARSYKRRLAAAAEYGARASALLLTYVLFFLIYRLIPDPPVGSGVALRSALWAGTAWEAAKYLFVINLARANLRLYYGPLAFAVSLVLWAYVSSLVLVFGALMVPARLEAHLVGREPEHLVGPEQRRAAGRARPGARAR